MVGRRGRTNANTNSSNDVAALVHKLSSAATRCRGKRQELSLLLAEPNVAFDPSDLRADLVGDEVRRALNHASAAVDGKNVSIITLSDKRTAAIFSNCERRAALAIANQTIAELGDSPVHGNRGNDGPATTLSIGVATMSVVPRN